MRRAAALFLIAASFGNVPAHSQELPLPQDDESQCELFLATDTNIQWDGPYSRGYDVFDEALAYEPLQVNVRHTGASCSFFVTATPVTGGGRAMITNGAGELGYDLLNGTNGPSIISASFAGTPSTRLEGTFPVGENGSNATLSFVIPPRQFVPSGQYAGQFVLRLYREVGTSWELVDEVPVDVVAQVPARLQISGSEFAAGSQYATIDLGELSNGARRDIGFDVSSNSRVRVELRSSNLGELKHYRADVGIPYRLMRDGSPVDLKNGGEVFEIGTSQGGLPLPLALDVAPGSYPAGSYSDVLTVTFTAQ